MVHRDFGLGRLLKCVAVCKNAIYYYYIIRLLNLMVVTISQSIVVVKCVGV